MAWSDLTDSQMVSFTDAQTSGFSLNSGQSQVTSNQCMTKSEALAKYNITISGYTDNQLVPKSAWVTGTSVTFSSWFYQSYTTGSQSTSGTVTIAGANATFNARAVVISGSTTCTTNVIINGTSISAYRDTPGTTSSGTITLSPGTYSYSVRLINSIGGLPIAGGIVYSQ